MTQGRITNTTCSSPYSDEKRIEAIGHYAVTGNMMRTAELSGVPRGTLTGWKEKEWWVTTLERVRHEKQDEIDANLTRIVHKATEALETRIDKGDEYINKEGKTALKAITGRDLATITGIIFDKRQILRNLPTSIKSESTDARLTQLADKVRQLQAGEVLIEHTTDTSKP